MADAAGQVFFDGETNRRHLVTVRFAGALAIEREGVTLATWGYADIRLAAAPADRMRLCCVAAPPLARLELTDPAAERAIRDRCPRLYGAGAVRPVAFGKIVAWSAAAVVVMIATIWFGLPALSDKVAEVVPPAWERHLGDAVDGQVRAVFNGPRCTGPDGVAALGKLVGTLRSAAQLPVDPDAVVLLADKPNAFALPGGRVYVLSPLIDRAASADELAGVLAHELGHLSHRDGLRRMVRYGGSAFLVGLLFGDVSGAGAGLFAARMLLDAAYSRDIEAEADGFSIGVMRRLGRPTGAMGDLLERIAGDGETGLSILSDHPLTPDRVERLRREDAAATGPVLLDGAEWRALKGICR